MNIPLTKMQRPRRAIAGTVIFFLHADNFLTLHVFLYKELNKVYLNRIQHMMGLRQPAAAPDVYLLDFADVRIFRLAI